MKRNIITTADGSKTIQIEDWDEQYHSKHGAIQEAIHVFIASGLRHYQETHNPSMIFILEVGFGTGLNAFLTLLESEKTKTNINFVGTEAYPLIQDELSELNYVEEIDATRNLTFKALHDVSWEKTNEITPNFKLTKRQQFFSDINDKEEFDIIYFDAFGARVQPELWTKPIFEAMYNALKPGGVLVTYAAIGEVKRIMKTLGFSVERLQGPPGKRHMLRATK